MASNPGIVFRRSQSLPPVDETYDPDAYSGLADAYRMSWLGQLADQVEVAAADPGGAGIDPFDHIPEGYEEYAGAFAKATSLEAIEVIRRNIDENLAARARREARGGWSTLGSDIVAGIIDPTNAIGAPALRGVGFLKGALRGSTVLGSIGAGTEIVRGSLDPTSPIEETVAGIGFSYLLGGGLGGLAGAIPGRAAAPAPAVDQGGIINFVMMDLEGGAQVTSDTGGLTKFGISARGNPGVDIANLDAAGAAAIYRRKYWIKELDGVDPTMAAIGFDTAVLQGPKAARKLLKQAKGDPGRAIELRRQALRDLADSNPDKYGKFLKGWMNRLDKLSARLGVDAAAGRMASGAGVDPFAAVSFLEGLEVPKEVQFDGRGVKVVVGPTGRYDENGNYIPAAHVPRREPLVDTASINNDPLPEPVASQREMLLADIVQPGEAPARTVIDIPGEVPPSVAAEARARLVTLAEGDAAFFGQLKKTPLYEEAALGLDRMSLKGRKRLAAALADELAGDDAKLSALFGDEVPRTRRGRVSAKAIEGRLTEVVKQRERLRLEGTPVAKGRARDEAEIERGEGRPDARFVPNISDDGMTEVRVDPEAPTFHTMDEAIAEMRAAASVRRNVDSLREAADNAESAKVARVMRGRADMLERGEIGIEDAWSGLRREANEAPFTASRSDADDLVGPDEEHFVIDADAVLASFDKKPWIRPRVDGVAPLPEGAFRTPGEWLNFVFLHEREHGVNPRREGESLADYENRINARALEAMKAEQLPFTPDGGRLADLAIRPTPIGQLKAMLGDVPNAQIFRDIQDLAGDMGTQLVANRAGAAAAAGGSVFQKTQRWIATMAELRTAIRREWLNHIKGNAPRSAKATEIESIAARVPFVGAARGKTGLRDFREQVFMAQATDAPQVTIAGKTIAISPEARAAARTLQDISARFEQAARDLGVFDRSRLLKVQQERLANRLASLEGRIAAAKALPEKTRADLDLVLASLRTRLDELAEEAAQPVLPRRASRYVHRIYDRGALEAGKDRAIAKLFNAYVREGADPERAMLQAKGAYDAMVGEADLDFVATRPGAVKSRTVPWTDEEALEFMVRDPELVMGIYTRRMGAAIEMTRRFGDPNGLEHEDELLADLLLRGVDMAKAQKALQIWRDARDHIAGAFHGKDPMSWDNRAARAIKNLTNLQVMGKVLFSQVNDIGRAIGTVGPAPLWKSLAGLMSGDLARFDLGPYAKAAGEALDLVMARYTARMIESETAILATGTSRIERGLAGAQAPFFTANLMIPFTVLMKEWVSVAAGHVLIDEARAVARAVQSGAAPDPAMIKRLAGNGIDVNDAQLLAAMPTETTDGGLHLANVMAWEGERGQRVRDLFLGAISGETRRSVITPGPLDRPAIMDGVFHTSKGREAGLNRVAEARERADRALANVRRLRAEGADEVVVQPFLDELGAARADLTQARRKLGQAGRIEAPLASLPLQLKSFVLASGAKMAHGLLTNRDRARAAGLVALMMGGVVSTWLKNKTTGRWDFMDWTDIAAESFDNSGIGAWMADIAQNIETTLDLAGEDRPGWNDEVGATAGVGPGVLTGLVEAFVSDDLEDGQRASLIRRAVPFNNLLWWDATVRALTRAMSADGDPAGAPAAAAGDPGLLAIMGGFTAEDRRARPAPAVEPPPPAPGSLGDADALLAAYQADPLRKRSKAELAR